MHEPGRADTFKSKSHTHTHIPFARHRWCPACSLRRQRQFQASRGETGTVKAAYSQAAHAKKARSKHPITSRYSNVPLLTRMTGSGYVTYVHTRCNCAPLLTVRGHHILQDTLATLCDLQHQIQHRSLIAGASLSFPCDAKDFPSELPDATGSPMGANASLTGQNPGPTIVKDPTLPVLLQNQKLIEHSKLNFRGHPSVLKVILAR